MTPDLVGRGGTVIAGVDPGAKHTGVVVAICGERTGELVLLRSRTIERDGESVTDYVTRVTRAIGSAVADRHRDRIVLGVEGVRGPVPMIDGKLSVINPEPLIMTAFVTGRVAGYWTDREPFVSVVFVPPGHNGGGVYGSYPAGLVTAQERAQPGWETRPAGRGKLRHERSGWDVARRAEQMDRPNRRNG